MFRVRVLGLVVAFGVAAIVVRAASERENAAEQVRPLPNSMPTTGNIVKVSQGERLLNGIVVKASPATGTLGAILVEQTFPKGAATGLHIHDQGDELFYVVSGRGKATLGSAVDVVEPGDVVVVAKGAAHRIENLERDEPLRVVFFMGSPELVEQFRAVHRRVTSEPDRPITDEERAAFARIGGMRPVK